MLCFEQSGFAQIAGQIDFSGYITQLRNSLVQDKFRPLHLRYLHYDPQANNFKLLLDKGNLKNPPAQEVESASKELLKYFLIGVSLPNDSFWVNLRPDSPDNIIDDALAKTDIGKILLEADVQLKKDTARFTSPDTREGKEYWDRLYKKAEEIFGTQNVTIPTLTRPWIVPNEIIIRETPDNAYIYKATLKVMLEEDYLKDSAAYNFKDERLKELNAYSSELIRELIIPKLTQEVNTAKRYAGLRQVYYSLILSQWFKQKFSGRSGLYCSLVDKKNLNGLTSKESWSKTTYFQAYQKSFKDGEYNFKVPVSTPFGQAIRSYFSGGIALADSLAAAIDAGRIRGSPNRPIDQGLLRNNIPVETETGSIENLVPQVAMEQEQAAAEASQARLEIIKNDLSRILTNHKIKNDDEAELDKLAQRIYEAQLAAKRAEPVKEVNITGINIAGLSSVNPSALGMAGMGGMLPQSKDSRVSEDSHSNFAEIIAGLRGGRKTLVGIIPGLTAEMEKAFRSGQITVLEWEIKGGRDIKLAETNGGQTMTVGLSWDRIGLDKKPSLEEKEKALKAYKAWVEAEVAFPKRDLKQAEKEFKEKYGTYGIEILNAASGGEIYYVMELLRLLPESVLGNPALRSINFKSVRDKSSRFAQYIEEKGEIGIVFNFIEFDKYMKTAYLLHELGHVVYRALTPEQIKRLEMLFGEFSRSGAFFGVDFMGMDKRDRIDYIKKEAKEFFAENFMHFIVLGSYGMIGAGDGKHEKLREDLANFYAELYGQNNSAIVGLNRNVNQLIESESSFTPDEARLITAIVKVLEGSQEEAVKILLDINTAPEITTSVARAYDEARKAYELCKKDKNALFANKFYQARMYLWNSPELSREHARYFKNGASAMYTLLSNRGGLAFKKALSLASEPAAQDESARRIEAEKVLGRAITDREFAAILEAHQVGPDHYVGIQNPDGTYQKNEDPAKAYTQQEITEKARILRVAGFNEDESRKLMEQGIAGKIAPFKFDSDIEEVGTGQVQELSKDKPVLKATLGVCLAVAAFNKKTGKGILAHFAPDGLIDTSDNISDKEKVKQRCLEELLRKVSGSEWQVAIVSSGKDRDEFLINVEVLREYLKGKNVENIDIDRVDNATKIVTITKDSSGRGRVDIIPDLKTSNTRTIYLGREISKKAPFEVEEEAPLPINSKSAVEAAVLAFARKLPDPQPEEEPAAEPAAIQSALEAHLDALDKVQNSDMLLHVVFKGSNGENIELLLDLKKEQDRKRLEIITGSNGSNKDFYVPLIEYSYKRVAPIKIERQFYKLDEKGQITIDTERKAVLYVSKLKMKEKGITEQDQGIEEIKTLVREAGNLEIDACVAKAENREADAMALFKGANESFESAEGELKKLGILPDEEAGEITVNPEGEMNTIVRVSRKEMERMGITIEKMATLQKLVAEYRRLDFEAQETRKKINEADAEAERRAKEAEKENREADAKALRIARTMEKAPEEAQLRALREGVNKKRDEYVYTALENLGLRSNKEIVDQNIKSLAKKAAEEVSEITVYLDSEGRIVETGGASVEVLKITNSRYKILEDPNPEAHINFRDAVNKYNEQPKAKLKEAEQLIVGQNLKKLAEKLGAKNGGAELRLELDREERIVETDGTSKVVLKIIDIPYQILEEPDPDAHPLLRKAVEKYNEGRNKAKLEDGLKAAERKAQSNGKEHTLIGDPNQTLIESSLPQKPKRSPTGIKFEEGQPQPAEAARKKQKNISTRFKFGEDLKPQPERSDSAALEKEKAEIFQRATRAMGRAPTDEEFAFIWKAHLTEAEGETGTLGQPDADGIYRHSTLSHKTKIRKIMVLVEAKKAGTDERLFSKEQIKRLGDYGAMGRENRQDGAQASGMAGMGAESARLKKIDPEKITFSISDFEAYNQQLKQALRDGKEEQVRAAVIRDLLTAMAFHVSSFISSIQGLNERIGVEKLTPDDLNQYGSLEQRIEQELRDIQVGKAPLDYLRLNQLFNDLDFFQRKVLFSKAFDHLREKMEPFAQEADVLRLTNQLSASRCALGFLQKYLEQLISRQYELEEVSLNEIVDLSVKEAKNKDVAVERGSEGKIATRGFTDQLQYMFWEILSNAVQYAKNVKVRLYARDDVAVAVIEVSDKGPGMTEEEIREYFKTGVGHSKGLGLPWAKLIAEFHKGSLKIESKVGEGTKVTIRLPLSVADMGGVSGPAGAEAELGKKPGPTSLREILRTIDPDAYELLETANRLYLETMASGEPDRLYLNSAVSFYSAAIKKMGGLGHPELEPLIEEAQLRLQELQRLQKMIDKQTLGSTWEGRLITLHKRLIERLKELQVAGKPLVIVDFGIGADGAPTTFDLVGMLEEAGLRNVRVIGVDINPDHIQQAGERLSRTKLPEGISLEFRKGGFRLAEENDLSGVSMILASNVMQHYNEADWNDNSKLLRQALVDNGELIVSFGPQRIHTGSIYYAVYNKDGRKLEDIEIPEEEVATDITGIAGGATVPVSTDAGTKPGGIAPSVSLGDNSQQGKTGGIDFRALPIVNQSLPLIQGQPPLKAVPVTMSKNPDPEWQQIQNMLNAGIIPSIERIKEYLQSCCDKEDSIRQVDKVLGCIADILRLEEDRVATTDSALKELLVLLESEKSGKELKFAISKIEVLPQEPQIIE